MGMFGLKMNQYRFGPQGAPNGYQGGSGIGDGMIERQQMNPDMAYQMPSIDGLPMAIPQQPQMQPMGNPMAGLGGYDQNAAMQGKSGFAPMNEGFTAPSAKKPGTNWAGIAADFLAGMAGQPGPFAAQQQHERAMQQRRQEADLTRQQGFQDYVRKAEYDRANPSPANPHYFETNDGSQGVIDPVTGQPKIIYKDPTPKMQWVPDGYGGGQMVPTTFGTTPPEGPAIGSVIPDPRKGGQTGKPSGNFR